MPNDFNKRFNSRVMSKEEYGNTGRSPVVPCAHHVVSIIYAVVVFNKRDFQQVS